ncbi:MAG: ferritin-like domain-containing protein, partial [Ignavibacteria bacterium]
YYMELETVMNYLACSIDLDGVRAEEIKKSLAMDIQEELTHATTLGRRIKELGGRIPGSSKFKYSQKYLQPPKDSTDVISVIKGVIEAEDSAIKHYNYLIKLVEGKDYVTQDLIIRTLASEERHKNEFEGFLKEYKKR